MFYTPSQYETSSDRAGKASGVVDTLSCRARLFSALPEEASYDEARNVGIIHSWNKYFS